MFAEDESWQQNDKLAVIEDLVKHNKRQMNLERQATKDSQTLPPEGFVQQAQDTTKTGRLFSRKKTEGYYGKHR
jgi:hypothetical protein